MRDGRVYDVEHLLEKIKQVEFMTGGGDYSPIPENSSYTAEQ